MSPKLFGKGRLVTFIRPPLVSRKNALNNEPTPSIGIAYLSGYLRANGYRTAVVDGVGEGLDHIWPIPGKRNFVGQGLTIEKIVERIPSDTDVVAISVMFSGEWPLARDLINHVKRHFPDVVTIAGGEHVTALPEHCLRDAEGLDYCVIGEGEHTLFEFCENLFTQGSGRGTRGVVFLDEHSNFVSCDEIPRIREVQTIPWPDWDNTPLEPFWKHGKSHGISSLRDMPILASRGCPYRCTFCSSPQMWTTRYILRDVDDLLDEIEHYVERFNVTSLQFYDLTAITKKKWIVEFCKKYLERGLNIKWTLPSGTRSEALDEESLELMAKTNCNYLVYAPESGCEETLRIIKKQVKLPRVTESMRTAKRNGIVVRANLIIGFPHETRKNIWNTLRFGLKLICLSIDEVTCFLFSPYPGSELSNQLVGEGRVCVNDDYFYGLASLNGDMTSMNPPTHCKKVGSRELAFYRLAFYITTISLSYLLFPRRIWRLLSEFFHLESSTVFEHRIKGALKARFSWLAVLRPRWWRAA